MATSTPRGGWPRHPLFGLHNLYLAYRQCRRRKRKGPARKKIPIVHDTDPAFEDSAGLELIVDRRWLAGTMRPTGCSGAISPKGN